ncbi:hypothetical protein [Tenacibaculum finnmarkense]|uniref:Uncharacterized protein n=1 Tax=Tenacibaculum finnmarkense genomovar ulcerans TaxID=2781388 RepID=A0A2I2M7T5_9FLAO|nr:hypothetical protein [Tenacibaculum finnmarkense]MBE7632849.1 hypothetical protein [Tenacibaculum finnmarkense genomovar ulcerans]MBE7687912.1 hypothetical protein [Tenacibaculum finnmarkense genomovar ulcerans]MBE7697210.1 hypothetical protein [Tenacibaculum finnmarkense genomovar ulcerans]MCD8428718.1 hypothetical protein [Tenacibaculum finnmarkense genomovar ulcerans]MCD8431192.1 hypothetical protein [Tenacibaculum finnmarkense genomovar ulcerans]
MVASRIKIFIKHKGVAVSRLERVIGASDGTLRNALKKGTEINSKWLGLISDNFPDLNFNWLITGKGTMLLTDEPLSLEDVENEKILDYILVHIDDFRKEPKINAIAGLFSNFEQQKDRQKLYDKIINYECLLKELAKNSNKE